MTIPPAPYPAPKTDPLAITSLVLGIIGIVFIPASIILSPIALVTGVRAKRRIAERGGSVEGTGIAQAGFILGIIGTVIAALVILAFGICVAIFASSGSMYG